MDDLSRRFAPPSTTPDLAAPDPDAPSSPRSDQADAADFPDSPKDDGDARQQSLDQALLTAARQGDEDEVRRLLADGARVTVVDQGARTALHHAASHGHAMLIDLLLEHGAPLDAPDRSGHTAVHLAALGGHRAAVARLIAHRADLQALNAGECSALLTRRVRRPCRGRGPSAATGRAGRQHGRRAVHPASSCSPAWPCGGGQAPLGLWRADRASLPGRIQGSSDPVHAPVPCRSRRACGGGEAAAAARRPRAVTGAFNCSPLYAAAQGGHLGVLEMLLEYGAPTESRDMSDPPALHGAALKGQVRAVQLLLRHHAKIEATDVNDRTALHHAAQRGETLVVQLLLRHQAQVDRRCVEADGSRSRLTALHLAAERGHADTLTALLQFGATIDAQDRSDGRPCTSRRDMRGSRRSRCCCRPGPGGHAAITAACRCIWRRATRSCRGSRPAAARSRLSDAADLLGFTPLIEAVQYHQLHTLETYSLGHGASTDGRSKDAGRTALHVAVINRDAAASEALLRHGASGTPGRPSRRTPRCTSRRCAVAT